jgi:hypothetical protein
VGMRRDWAERHERTSGDQRATLGRCRISRTQGCREAERAGRPRLSAGVTLGRAGVDGRLHCGAMRRPFRTQNAAVTGGFFIAPLVPSILIPLTGAWRFPPEWGDAAVMYVGALPIVFIFGLPLFLLFSKFRMFSWWGSILAGGLSGIAIDALLGGISNLWGYPLSVYGATGAGTGIVFWAVVMWGPEPNQSAARNWAEPFRRRRGN